MIMSAWLNSFGGSMEKTISQTVPALEVATFPWFVAHFQASNSWLSLYYTAALWLLTLLPPSFTYKDICNDIGLTWIIQGTFPISTHVTHSLNSFCNLHLPLACPATYLQVLMTESLTCLGGYCSAYQIELDSVERIATLLNQPWCFCHYTSPEAGWRVLPRSSETLN